MIHGNFTADFAGLILFLKVTFIVFFEFAKITRKKLIGSISQVNLQDFSLQFYQSGPYHKISLANLANFLTNTARKMKFSNEDFFSKCDQIRRKLRIWSHLLKKFLMENFILCIVKWTKIFKLSSNVISISMFISQSNCS